MYTVNYGLEGFGSLIFYNDYVCIVAVGIYIGGRLGVRDFCDFDAFAARKISRVPRGLDLYYWSK